MNIYFCCDERRRDAVRALHTLEGIDFNGIDYLEVVDVRTLLVHFIHPLQPAVLGKENVRITGGARIDDVQVVEATVEGEQKEAGEKRRSRANIFKIRLNKEGDYSTYTLQIVANPATLVLDPLLSSIDFTFNLPSNGIDCAAEAVCLPEAQPVPEIDYLARDFTSFRQLMLDRLSVLMPQWNESSAADIGVMLVEVLAYVADHLSYQQDVIATESYLSTARRRVSARRHARLLDYSTNEGCNARVWVQMQVNADITTNPFDTASTPVLPVGTLLFTQIPDIDATVLTPDTPLYMQAVNTQPTAFETMEPVRGLFAAHNTISFYTWGARECCLPQGATKATLRGALLDLQPGDVLVFQEMVNAQTGSEDDAEPAHRHAVRLTTVVTGSDPLGAWPNDQSGAPGDPTHSGKVIAEFEIVEKDRLLIEEAHVTVSHSGQRVEKQEERTDEETHTVTHRYLIEKPDKTTLTVEVRMPTVTDERENDVEVEVLEAGHVVQHQREIVPGEKGEESDDDANTPTGKLSHEARAEEVSKKTETTTEQRVDEEKGKRKDEFSEETRTDERVIHTYRILREPDYSVPVTSIEWNIEDALPFPLCISAVTNYENGHRSIEDVSVALGNMVLADHGITRTESAAQQDYLVVPNIVPFSAMNWAPAGDGQPCDQQQPQPVPQRFYPQLKYSPLTFAVPYATPDAALSATGITTFDARDAVPAISLQSNLLAPDGSIVSGTTIQWNARNDLLSSGPTDAHFVVDAETDGTTFLHFGDDRHGMRPDSQTAFLATYRVGNGLNGNIGQDSLCHIVLRNDTDLQVRLSESIIAINNPLPALGGVDPEGVEDIRQNATGAFTLQDRGVTPQDFITIVTRDAQVHRANAILRWTGSWYTLFLVVERARGLPVDDLFKQSLRQSLEQYRMAGTDLVVVSPVYVPLEIDVQVTVKQGYLPANVQAALSKVFSNRQWPDGTRGVFYPDNFSFGQTVYLNPLYVAASALPGVDTVKITRFQRQGIAGTGLTDGSLAMDWLEIPILENNPQYPERGLFTLSIATPTTEAQYV